MPTWRSKIVDFSEEEFLKTDFYLYWKDVIENKELLRMMRNCNFLIKFYLHSSFQKYSKLFKSNEYVKVILYDDETVQNLLIESKLLITDYSSVYFDFAYLNKPIIYYQFDENDYYSSHYEKGYFDYRNNGFGDVCVNLNELLISVKKIIDNQFCIENKYKERINQFFVFRDHDNCNRVFDSILKL